MQNPNTGPAVGSPRLRPSHAPSKPALEGAGGGRLPKRARVLHGPVTPAQRDRIERDIERLIELLNRLDGDADTEGTCEDDGEPEHEGCCEAGDDDPARSLPIYGVHTRAKAGPGDPDDAEDSDGLEPADDDMRGLRLTLRRPLWGSDTQLCGPDILKPDTDMHAVDQGRRSVRTGRHA